MARCSAVCVFPAQPDLPDSDQSERAGPVVNHDSTTVDVQTVVGGNNSAASGRTVVAPRTQRFCVPGELGNLPPAPRPHGALGLACERWILRAAGLPVQTLLRMQKHLCLKGESEILGK